MAFEKAGFMIKVANIQPVQDVRAVPPGSAPAGPESERPSGVAAEAGLNSADARAFEKAGWTFVKSSDTESAGGKEHSVVVDGDGHLKILADGLNVKFEPELSKSAIDKILQQHGLSIRRGMGFAPNLFTVAGSDPLGKAKSLNQVDGVVYAEPVLIEPIQGRR